MKEIKIKLNDNVKLFNGTFGRISNINLSTYQVEISGDHMYPEWTHIVNIESINDINCENFQLSF